MRPKIDFLNLGRIDYTKAWDKQKELLQLRIENKINDTFVFCEHTPVITLGRKSKRSPLLLNPNSQIEVIEVERGGEATYHGPGQLVCYPIVKLSPQSESQFTGGLVCFIRFLELSLIDLLKTYGISSKQKEGETGVWISDEKKIASIGIAAKKWVTYHGLALNFNTGREVWMQFNPCGYNGNVMTDMTLEKASTYKFDVLSRQLEQIFIKRVAESQKAANDPCPLI